MTFSNFNTLGFNNPLGTGTNTPVFTIFAERDPTTSDNAYQPATEWQNTVTGIFWKLRSTGTLANWVQFAPTSSGTVATLTGDTGGAVPPDGAGNISVLGTAGQIIVTGTPGMNKLVLSLAGGGTAVDEFVVDAFTPPGTNPVVPDGTGQVTITGGQAAAGSIANSIQTNSLAANTYTIEVQRSSSSGVTNAALNGVSHFNSSEFTVDANGFVNLVGGSAAISKVAVQTGTSPVVPAAGIITINGATVAAGTNPVRTDGTGANTLAVEVQRSQALAASDATKIGLCNFSSAQFTVDGNGFVQLAGGATGAVETLTGNSGGAIGPTAGNINTLGSGSITIVGAGSTLTTQLTGLTNHNVLVGAGTDTITKVAPSATTGVPLVSQGAAADPAFGTASIAGGGTNATSFSTTNGIVKFDGTSLVTSTTDKIDASNRQTNTAQPSFLATISATINNVTGDSTAYSVVFNTSIFDQASNFNTGTGVFTAPVAGVYAFQWATSFTNVQVGMLSYGSIIVINGTLSLVGNTGNPTNAQSVGNFTAVGSCVIKLAASDTVYIQVAVTGGAKVVGLIANTYPGQYQNHFSGCLLC
jgi:hypothetical protein